VYGTLVYENAAVVSKQPDVIAPQNESTERKRLWWTSCRGRERFPADSLFVVTFITSSCCWEYYVCTSHLMWNIRGLIRAAKNLLNVWPMKNYDWRILWDYETSDVYFSIFIIHLFASCTLFSSRTHTYFYDNANL